MFRNRNMEEGQGLVEYALIIVLVGIVVIAALTLFGEELALFYQGALDRIAELT